MMVLTMMVILVKKQVHPELSVNMPSRAIRIFPLRGCDVFSAVFVAPSEDSSYSSCICTINANINAA